MNGSWNLLFSVVLAATAVRAGGSDRFLPPEELNLVLKAPIDRWDEAVPLGNGLLGGLLWGKGNRIRLSLDRGDLWDLRTPEVMKSESWTWATIRKLVSERNKKKIDELFDRPYNLKYPTKIPGGRLEITLDPSRKVVSFSLDLARAVGKARFEDGKELTAFFNAREPVALIRIPAPAPSSWRLVAPAAVKQLGYEPAEEGRSDNEVWFLQRAALGLSYAAVAAKRRIGESTLIAVTITSSKDGGDPLSVGRERVRKALERGYERNLGRHLEYWTRFWSASRIRVPDLRHLRHYYLVQYFYGSASRLGAPPIPLQGVWTADAGTLPPWKGDYHNDLNTQMTYCAYQASGRFEEGRCFLEFLWTLLPAFRSFARKFYGAPGAAVPGVMTLDGKPMGGWPMYSLSPTKPIPGAGKRRNVFFTF